MLYGILIASMAIAAMGGLIRGATGFGGSLVMTPALALMYEPKLIIPTVLLLETFAAVPMLRGAMARADFRVITPICAAAFLTVPLGGYLLVNMDPVASRRWIACTVIVFALLLLKKIRYTGARKWGPSLVVGSLSGVLLGGTGIGGPPIILYILSGTGSIDAARANLTLVASAISVAGLGMLWFRGLIDFNGPVSPFVLGPFFYLGTVLGMRFFRRFSEQGFRQFTLLLLIAVSLVALIR
jgi:uncharacterized membrane protein YfcA